MKFIRKNHLNATLTFNHRVKMFLKNNVMSKGSPMCVKNFNYKVEFALRGAAHIHGVLWLDWKTMPMEKDEKESLMAAFKKINCPVKHYYTVLPNQFFKVNILTQYLTSCNNYL